MFGRKQKFNCNYFFVRYKNAWLSLFVFFCIISNVPFKIGIMYMILCFISNRGFVCCYRIGCFCTLKHILVTVFYSFPGGSGAEESACSGGWSSLFNPWVEEDPGRRSNPSVFLLGPGWGLKAAVRLGLQSQTWEVTAQHIFLCNSLSWQIIIGWTCYLLPYFKCCFFLKKIRTDTSCVFFIWHHCFIKTKYIVYSVL